MTFGLTQNNLAFVYVDALDEAGDVIAQMEETQVFGDPMIPDGTMSVSISQPGQPQFDMRSIGREITGGYEVAATLEYDGNSVDVDMVFERLPCNAVEAVGPDCAGVADVTDGRVSVPTCGLVYNTEDKAGLDPQLTELRYRANGTGEAFVVNGANTQSIRPVVLGGEMQALNDVESWLNANAAGVIGTDAEALFSAIYTDMTWRDIVDQISAECQAAIGSALVPRCQTLVEERGKFTTIRQASCGNAGGRDIPSWAQGGSLPTPKHKVVCGANGCSFGKGDPHLGTFDGHRYDFQGAGDYTLVKTPGWEIQARMEPLATQSSYTACQSVSYFTAIALEFGADTFEFRAAGEVLKNGVVQTDLTGSLADGLKLMVIGGEHALEFADGTVVTMFLGGRYLNIEVQATEALKGQTSGLLGTFDDSTTNDLALRNGRALDLGMSFREKYDVFGESWRVNDTTSLFTYEAGEGPETFALAGFPEGETNFDDVPDNVLNQAAADCETNDLAMARDCILDVICASESGGTEKDAPPESATPAGKEGLVLSGDVREENREQLAIQSLSNICPVGDRPFIGLRDLGTTTLTAAMTTDQGTIPAGTEVHLWEAELAALAPEDAVRKGAVTFPTNILGTISQTTVLRATDGVFNASTSTGPEADDILISQGRGLNLELYSADDADLVRIVTEVNP